jgi:hypothetical protein
MTIIEYKNCHNITVKFNDGIIIKLLKQENKYKSEIMNLI